MADASFAHHPRTLLHIAPYLRRRSISPTDVFQRAGVSPATMLTPNGWVPRETCFRLSNEIFALTGDRYLGAEISRSFELSHLGTWGLTVSSARTLREAINVAISGLHLIHQGTKLQCVTTGRSVALSFAFEGRSAVNPLQHLLGALGVLRKAALLAGEPDAVGARFRQPYERTDGQLEDTFGARLAFGCGDDAIVIDREILDLPLPPRGPCVHDPLRTAESLCTLVTRLLPYHRVTVDMVASELHMSTRTLQRRLADWGFSFEEMLDDLRRSEAMRMLRTSNDTATEIAFTLGYSDPAHFTRAFRRWTGMAPRGFRAGLATAAYAD